jgi:putative transposase
MPRKARLDAPGILHHVIVGGIERRPVFSGTIDRRDFTARCAALFPESKTACYAWALLSNHAHLLLRTGIVPLSTVMARLLSGYATAYNLRHHRSGHLFQNRYKSIICQEEPYFKELVRYIHLNPLRSRQVSDLPALALHPWSGHAALLNKRACLWQDVSYVLSVFGDISAYLRFVEQGLTQGHRPDLMGGGLIRSNGGWREITGSRTLMKGDERILGDTSFVVTVLAHAGETLERRAALHEAHIDLDTVAERVCDLFAVISDDLYGKGRQRRLVEARSLYCFWAARELGIPQKALALRFSVTEPAISYAVTRGQRIARERGFSLITGI